MPETLKVLSEGAFAYCRNLEEIVLPEGLRDILYSACAYCNNLKELTIPDSVEFIAQTAFWESFALEHVYISKNSNLEILGCRAFYHCTSLTEFYIPPKLTYLDSRNAKTTRNASSSTAGSFEGCTALTTVTFSKTLTGIYQGCFTGCNRITTINYEGTEEEWLALRANIGTKNTFFSSFFLQNMIP